MSQSKANPFSHVAIYLVARGVPGLISFMAIPLFTRLLSPADYGRYALVAAAAALLNALVFQWLRLSMVRYLPAHQESPAALKNTLVSMTIGLIAAIGIIATIVCLFPIGNQWRGVVLCCWLMLAVQSLFELCCEYARSAIKPWYFMLMQVGRAAGTLGIAVLLIVLGASWLGPVVGMAAGSGLLVIYAYFRDWRQVRLNVDRQILGRVCQYGIPLSLTVALTVVMSTCDRFLIAALMGAEAAGIFSVATDFTSQTITLLLMSVSMASFPLAVRAWEQHGLAAAQQQMKFNISLLLATGVPCVVGLAVLAPGIVRCFLGEEYRAQAISIVPWMALATLAAGLKAYHFDSAFQFAHKTIFQVWIVLAAAILNVVLNFIAIPRWGLHGAAGASLTAFVCSIGMTAYFGRRHFPLPFPVLEAAKVLLATGVMAVVIYPFRSHVATVAVAAQVALGAVVYAIVLIATNFLNLRDQLLSRVRAGIAGSEQHSTAAVAIAEAS